METQTLDRIYVQAEAWDLGGNEESHHEQRRPIFFFGLHRYFQGKHDICGHHDLFFGLHRFLVEKMEIA